MFGPCVNIPYETVSINNMTKINNQITICDSSDYDLESISLKLYMMNKKHQNEYSIKDEVLTKTEREIENMNNKYYKKYDSIIIDGKRIVLLKPVVFLVEQSKEGCFLTNKNLNILANGKTFENAEEDMYEEFLIQWELYANEKDENLTPKAQVIKRNLLESVKL